MSREGAAPDPDPHGHAWSLPALGAVAGLVIGIALVPGAEDVNNAYSAGERVGFVARYVVLVLVAGWLVHRLRAGGSPSASRRLVAGLVVVAGLAIVPPVIDGLSGPPAFRAGYRSDYVAGCSQRRPASFCGCVYDAVSRLPEYDTEQKFNGAFEGIGAGAPVPAKIQHAVDACAQSARP